MIYLCSDEIMANKDGMTYAPKGKPMSVVEDGDYVFSVAGLNHGHIYGMTNGLIEAGATIKYVWDDDQERLKRFLEAYPTATVCEDLQSVLDDRDSKMIACACITSERPGMGMKVMAADKDFFVDKAPFTTLDQIDKAEKMIKETGRRYFVYYSEMIHSEGAVYAKQLVDQGLIGQVVQVMNLGPHRLNASGRPDWFFIKEKYGGILCDIGCHNIYQFLEYANTDTAKVVNSHIANHSNPDYPELDDFGEASLITEKGQSQYFRVDWYTPDGLGTWGDGRLFILGTKGYIEVRKYIDAGRSEDMDNVLFVNNEREQFESVAGKVGFPFFGQMILDSLKGTENAQSQKRALEASRLAIIAQNKAVKLK